MRLLTSRKAVLLVSMTRVFRCAAKYPATMPSDIESAFLAKNKRDLDHPGETTFEIGIALVAFLSWLIIHVRVGSRGSSRFEATYALPNQLDQSLEMLFKLSTAVQFLSRRFFFSSNAEDATAADEQGLEIDARLSERWFAEIPHCTLRCLYGPALACGCAHSDYGCICRAFSEIADNEDIKTCITACPHNPDNRWAPDRILDFCQLVTGDDIRLPDYMNQYAGLHRRQAIPLSSFQDGAVTSYSDFISYYEPSATTIFITTSESTTATAAKSVITSAPTTLVSASSPSSLSASSSSSTFSSSPSSSAPSSSAPSGGLSTGAKAGIGVAVPLVVIGIVLGLFLWSRRKKREDKKDVHRETGGNNLSDMYKGIWPKNFFSTTTSGSLPAEADSNPIHESDSKPVTGTAHLRSSDTSNSPVAYELSAQPSIRAAPATVLASHVRSQSTNKPGSPSQMAIGSPVSLDDCETATGRGADTTTLDNTTSTVVHQKFAENKQENAPPSLEVTESTDTELLNLEAEIARVREQRERLQHLQLLEEREEQLRNEIAARKSKNA